MVKDSGLPMTEKLHGSINDWWKVFITLNLALTSFHCLNVDASFAILLRLMEISNLKWDLI